MKQTLILLFFFSLSNAFSVEVNLKKSWLRWKGEKVTGHHFGPLKLKKVSLNLEGDLIKGGEFIVDMDSIDSDDMDGKWKKKLVSHLKSDDFFFVKKYKTSTLKLIGSKKLKDDVLQVQGILKIKGIEKPISFVVRKKEKTYTGKLVFDRTKYNIKYKSGSFFKELGDKMIYDNVQLSFSIQLKN
jgi:hypothetical protein